MSNLRWSTRRARVSNRVHARLSGLARPATAFVSQPEPRSIGSFARGRQLAAGNVLLAGQYADAAQRCLWDLPAEDPAFDEERHGFAWLDDLAAAGDAAARIRAQAWLGEWITRYGKGTGPGWTPDLTGRRLIRWISHGLFLLRGIDSAGSHAFFRSLAHQSVYLGRRWRTASRGLPRFEALTGLLYAGLSLEGMDRFAGPAAEALAEECAREIDAQGGIPTRNPEELLEVFSLLTWASAALCEAGQAARPAHQEAIARIAPTLRSLRHSDGGLARFHGGGRGAEGRLDLALAASGVKPRAPMGLAMGFMRLSGGRTSLIADASPPPQGEAGYRAHASTLAFELTSGRRPVIVSAGSGIGFGQDLRRAARATQCHSTLCLQGRSSAHLGERAWVGGQMRALLEGGPHRVPLEISEESDGTCLQFGHDGYVASHGLTHARTLELTFDGRGLAGEDLLVAIEPAHRSRFGQALDATALQGVRFDVRFHLHPDVDASIDLGGAAVSLALKSGEIWVFRHDGTAQMTLAPSFYLQQGRLKPRATKQIVLSAAAMEYATRVRWSLAKAQESLVGIRDVAEDSVEPVLHP